MNDVANDANEVIQRIRKYFKVVVGVGLVVVQ